MNARPVKLTDGSWAVLVDGQPEPGDTLTVCTLEGKRWEATVIEVHATDPHTGEVLCRAARGPSLPDASPEELEARQRRAAVWHHAHEAEAAARGGCFKGVAVLAVTLAALVLAVIGAAW